MTSTPSPRALPIRRFSTLFPSVLLVASILAASHSTRSFIREIRYAIGGILPEGIAPSVLTFFEGRKPAPVRMIVTTSLITLWTGSGVMISWMEGFRLGDPEASGLDDALFGEDTAPEPRRPAPGDDRPLRRTRRRVVRRRAVRRRPHRCARRRRPQRCRRRSSAPTPRPPPPPHADDGAWVAAAAAADPAADTSLFDDGPAGSAPAPPSGGRPSTGGRAAGPGRGRGRRRAAGGRAGGVAYAVLATGDDGPGNPKVKVQGVSATASTRPASTSTSSTTSTTTLTTTTVALDHHRAPYHDAAARRHHTRGAGGDRAPRGGATDHRASRTDDDHASRTDDHDDRRGAAVNAYGVTVGASGVGRSAQRHIAETPDRPTRPWARRAPIRAGRCHPSPARRPIPARGRGTGRRAHRTGGPGTACARRG